MIMKIMNVVYNFNTGGVERLIIDVSNQLISEGHECYLCIINDSYSQDLLDKMNSKVKVFFLEKNFRFHRFNYIRQLLRIIKKERIEVLHVHQGNLLSFYTILKAFKPKLRIYYTVHDTKIFFELSKLNQYLSSHVCTKIIAISEAVKHDILTTGINEKQVVRVYNSIDVSRFLLKKERRNNSKIVLGNVARFVPHKKGQDLLVEALNVLKNKGYSFTCYFAGAPTSVQDSDYLSVLDKIKAYNLSNDVKLLGNVNDIPELLHDLDFFVIPSRFEGFGIAAVEALASGLPCVASNIDGLVEVINSKDLGLLFEMGSIDSLSKALEEMIQNIDKYNPINIHEDVCDRFSVKKMVTELLEVYKKR